MYKINEHFFNINESFENEYDNWNKIDNNGSFVVGEVEESLMKVGLLKQNIVIDKNKLIKIKEKHEEMSDDLIKQIPTILNNPILILKSHTVKTRIVIFGEVFDKNNNPIMIAMELNPDENNKNINKIYKIVSVYGRENIEYIKYWLENTNNIIFADYKNDRINKWLASLDLELPILNDKLTIKSIPINERPRERALNKGIDSLSNEELIAIILKTGTKNCNVKILSNRILCSVKNISDLKNLTVNTLIKIPGIGKVKAIELLASLELGKRVYYNKSKNSIKLNNSKKIYDYFKDLFINEKQENFYAIYLDAKSNLITYKLLFKGTINTSCVHPREVFKYAFLESAYSIVVFHNHPSGDSMPSVEDEEITKSLFDIGQITSIPVVDHIVFGKDEYFSFYEYYNKKENSI